MIKIHGNFIDRIMRSTMDYCVWIWDIKFDNGWIGINGTLTAVPLWTEVPREIVVLGQDRRAHQ